MSFTYTFEFDSKTYYGIENVFGIDDSDGIKDFGNLILPIQSSTCKDLAILNFSTENLYIDLKITKPFYIKDPISEELLNEYTVALTPFYDTNRIMLVTNEGTPIVTDELKRIEIEQKDRYLQKVLATDDDSLLVTDTGKILRPWSSNDFIKKVLASDEDLIITTDENKIIKPV